MAHETLLTLDEAAARLTISRKTLRDWLKPVRWRNPQGQVITRPPKLRGVKIGREWRIVARDLEAFLAQALGPQPPETSAPEAVEAPAPLRLVPTPPPEAQAPMPRHPPVPSAEQRKVEIVARLRHMKAQGLSLQAIATQLNAEGVPTLSGRGRWQKGTISDLLAQAEVGSQ